MIRRLKFLSIVVPTYRGAKNLRQLINQISAAMSSLHLTYEVIVVNDNSQDGCDIVIAKLTREDYPVRIITRIGERELSSAVIRGFGQAKGDTLVCMDGDLSHAPEAIPRLIECLEDGEIEFVIGSRYVPGGSTEETWGAFRWLNSKVETLLARPFTRVKDPMSGFFGLPRAVFERAQELNPVGYKIGLELIVKCCCKNIREIPIHFANRKYGKSKLSLKEQANYIKHLKRLADFKYGDFSRFIQFCLVGLTGMAVDLVAYTILLYAAIGLTVARGVAIWMAMNWNFWLNRRLTFSYGRIGNTLSQYLRFIASCAIGAVISWSTAVLLSTKVPYFFNHFLLAALIGIVSGALCNFLLSRYWVFRRLSPAGQKIKENQ